MEGDRYGPAQRQRAAELYKLGLTSTEICGALDVSQGWVWKVLGDAGIKSRPAARRPVLDSDKRRALLRMRADGLGIVEIGRELDVSYSAVYAFLRAKERTTRIGRLGRRPLSDEHREAIIDELRAGKNYETIAQRHGTTKQNISLIARKNGLGRR